MPPPCGLAFMAPESVMQASKRTNDIDVHWLLASLLGSAFAYLPAIHTYPIHFLYPLNFLG